MWKNQNNTEWLNLWNQTWKTFSLPPIDWKDRVCGLHSFHFMGLFKIKGPRYEGFGFQRSLTACMWNEPVAIADSVFWSRSVLVYVQSVDPEASGTSNTSTQAMNIISINALRSHRRCFWNWKVCNQLDPSNTGEPAMQLKVWTPRCILRECTRLVLATSVKVWLGMRNVSTCRVLWLYQALFHEPKWMDWKIAGQKFSRWAWYVHKSTESIFALSDSKKQEKQNYLAGISTSNVISFSSLSCVSCWALLFCLFLLVNRVNSLPYEVYVIYIFVISGIVRRVVERNDNQTVCCCVWAIHSSSVRCVRHRRYIHVQMYTCSHNLFNCFVRL